MKTYQAFSLLSLVLLLVFLASFPFLILLVLLAAFLFRHALTPLSHFCDNAVGHAAGHHTVLPV